MIRDVKDPSPDQKMAVETLLRHLLLEIITRRHTLLLCNEM